MPLPAIYMLLVFAMLPVIILTEGSVAWAAVGAQLAFLTAQVIAIVTDLREMRRSYR